MNKMIVEKVNEFEFTPGTKTRNLGGHTMNIPHPYSYDYEATISLKVGNVVKDATLREQRSYSQNEEDTYEFKRENPFKDLIDAGLEIDFSTITEQFKELVAKAKEEEKKLDEEWQIKVRKHRKERYPKTWAVKFSGVIDEDKNKKIQEIKDEVTITPVSEEDYIKTGEAYLHLAYKGFTTKVTYYDKKLQWSDAIEGDKYQRISSGKYRKSVNEGTVFLKFVEAVNEFIVTRDYEKKRNNKARQERLEHKELLEKSTGLPVSIIKRERYSNEGRRNRSWIEYYYLLVFDVPDSEYGDFDGLKINTYQPTKWNNDKKEYEPNGAKTFSINCFQGLSEKKFKAILDILLEDKKIINTSEIKHRYLEN